MYLEQTIKSVINQDYNNIEYIIIDGKSSDGTLDIIKQYKDHVSILRSEEDSGIYDAMNKGISLANGEIVGIINSDDYYCDGAFNEAVSALDSNDNFEIFYGKLRRLYKSNRSKIIDKSIPNTIQQNKINVVHPAVFVKKRVYDRKKFDTSLKIAADLDFLLSVCNTSNVIKSDKIISCMRTGGLSSRYCLSVKEMFIVYNRFLSPVRTILILLKILMRSIPALVVNRIRLIK